MALLVTESWKGTQGQHGVSVVRRIVYSVPGAEYYIWLVEIFWEIERRNTREYVILFIIRN
jgi:hypothetical protein